MEVRRKGLFRNRMPALRQVLLLLMLALPLTTLLAQVKMTRAEYVEMYKEIAIREMIDFSIPASITLAQAIIESGNGNSRLAREGNNHFGIKCHLGWEGKTMFVTDDAPDECFRVYATAEESFKDHSFFLSQRGRYAFLFDLKITDYKGWAHGLKKAGYATNPKYADMLIKLIEEMELHKFDLLYNDALARQKPPDEIPKADQRKYEAFGVGKNDRKVLTNNERKFIFARKGDDFYKIAADFNIYYYQVWKYNDLTKKDKIKEGDMVYLQRKKNKANTPYHFVKQGETMRGISQLYGMKLKQLYSKNRMAAGTQPRTGQMLWLQDKKPKE